MSARGPLPGAVLEAATISFELGITAYLFEPQLVGFCLEGTIYLDRKDRFQSGRLIRTSAVMEFETCGGYVVAMTWSGSRYVLVADDGPWVLTLPDRRLDEPVPYS